MNGVAARTVERFLDAFGRCDVDAAMAEVDDEVTVIVHPLHIEDKGAQALREVLHDAVTAFPDLRLTVARLIVTGDVVTVQLKLAGTQAAEYVGAINQEKYVDLDEAWRFVVTDGTIVAVTAFWCQQQLYRRLAVKRFDQVAIA